MEHVNTPVPTLRATLAALVTLAMNSTAMDSTAQVSINEVDYFVLNIAIVERIINRPHADIDECARNGSGCLSNSDCMNTKGNYTCPCNNGFVGDGFTGCESKLCYFFTLNLDD